MNNVAEPQAPTQPQPDPIVDGHATQCIGISGGSGFVGRHLLAEAERQGIECVVFSRDPAKSVPGAVEVRKMDPDPEGPLPDLTGLDGVVNLAGESILGLWSTRKKERMLQSRVQTTRKLVAAMKAMDPAERPSAFVNASGIHVYGNTGEQPVTEEVQPQVQDNFLAEISELTESSAMQAEELGVRPVPLRISMVLGVEEGAFPMIHGIFSKGLGGKLGSGKQWMSWIHAKDLARLILYCLQTASIKGPLNATSPRSVRNEEFTRTLSELVQRPAIFHAPSLALKLLLGEFSTTALVSIRGVPQKAMAAGFTFEYPELEPALRDLLSKMK